MTDTGNGIVVYRASRLEALLGPLQHLLDTQPPAGVLTPQTVIAAHPGMRQWLSAELARGRAAHGGIAANLDILLPSAWLDRLARQVLGEAAVAVVPYQRGALRWRIHELLGRFDAPTIRAYLGGNDIARRRYQLADRLARIYSQYIVYRPDWLGAWAAGRKPARDPQLDAGFLAPLWRRLRTEIGLPHRGELFDRLVGALNRGGLAEVGEEPLHVFGLSHLAPMELAVLRALARHRTVVFYVPDPCREYWGGLRADRSRLREQAALDAFGTDTERLFLGQDHPLLASWGRMGQHFLLALEDSAEVVVQDVRHWQDKQERRQPVETATEPDDRLHRVQESIRRLDPALLVAHGDAHHERADRSLRVHACHTRLRELEVLRDALLRELAQRPTLKPADIVVMAPHIRDYLPLLPAVFGEAGRHRGPLPYHLADVAVARSHPLFEAFRRLLDLPQSRLTAPEVIDLLALPGVARRFGLDEGDIETLSGWLRNSRVAWALDPEFRARHGVPAIAQHTFAWGMERLLAGYVMGAGDVGETLVADLPDGSEIAPLDGIHGPPAALLGVLDALLVEVAGFLAEARGRFVATQWAQRLERRFEALFLIDPTDPGARDAKTLLLGFIRAIGSEPQHSGLDPELEFSVVREVLLERLDAVPERQRFLMGGVTFCGMVPQRAIPFGVVAVLGLDDGAFPRAANDGGLDLMSRHRRFGDRDVRGDDRYLFLETLMSARHALHLSYIGEGVRDGKPRNPAAPLAELLATLDAAAGLHPGDPDCADGGAAPNRRPWLVRHPLQPFDARYFDGSDPALFSFRHDFADMVKGAARAATPFLVPATEPGVARSDEVVALREVLAYFRNPARQLLETRIKLRLDALDVNGLRENEPLEAKFEALDGVARRVFLEALAQPDRGGLPAAAPAWLRLTGLLPPGRPGEQAWNEESARIGELLVDVAAHPLFAGGVPQRAALALEREIAGYRIEGELARACVIGDVGWIFDLFPGKAEADLDFRQRIGLFIEWALLRLDDPDGHHAARICVLTNGGERPWQAAINAWDEAFVAAARGADHGVRDAMRADLQRRIGGLLAFWSSAQAEPRWYFPKTSWAAVASDKPGAVSAAWEGGAYATGERDYLPGYARLLAGEREFAAGAPERLALHADAVHLFELIHLGAPEAHAA